MRLIKFVAGSLRILKPRLKPQVVAHQPVAVHLLRPADAKHVHDFVAVAFGLQTQPAAGRGRAAILAADGRVQSAQKHPELGGALQVDHGVEGLREDWEGGGDKRHRKCVVKC